MTDPSLDLSPGAVASRAQAEASDPAVSSFVAASAGSGKTKLLTDRLLRLMLGGADPARIQCLTYTKAAAAEMALRLRAVLGEWATLDDAELDVRLGRLAVAASPEARATARALFARVLDLPGGMRIGTIHAFCQSLLRRFPLEANLSPHFVVAEEIEASRARDDAREATLARAAGESLEQALLTVAGTVALMDFDKLIHALHQARDRLAAIRGLPHADRAAAQRRVLAVEHAVEAVLLQAADWPGHGDMAATLRELADHKHATPAHRERTGAMLDWLALPAEARALGWSEWLDCFVTGEGKACAESTLVGNKVHGHAPHLRAALLAEQARAMGMDARRRAAIVAEISAAVLALAEPMMSAYEAGKALSAKLDYADLVARTERLLELPGAAWVLYKLDGGLDHLLLDEVQDTAPAQWRIAHAMTEEFFAGAGARADGRPRTVFAVGDRKQSIFSFQGAEPDAFDMERVRLGERVKRAGLQWRDVTMDVSFRSAAPVLALVDAVFADPVAAKGVVADPAGLHHQAHRAGQAGRVELWPLSTRTAEPPPGAWTVPAENQRGASAARNLVERLADWLARETAGHTMLESQGRPLAPGDVLVLLRRRGTLAAPLVRALKQRGVPVAGLDRMVLPEQPAVADMLALCDAILLPADDLALACVLTSPLGFLSQDELEALALGRRQSLFETLRARADERPAFRRALDFLLPLLARADFVTPHALLAEALGPLGGRARLLARMGPEAAEPLDELLAAALAFERTQPPSLQGFVDWLRRASAEIKREPEAAGNAVRIMTVHAAKGLQAPLVVLPDTTGAPNDEVAWLWGEDAATEGLSVPIWAPRAALRNEAMAPLHAAHEQRIAEEHNRLFYVALTRAEDRLVICGALPGNSSEASESCWYTIAARGFERLGARAESVPEWRAARLVFDSPQTAAPESRRAARGEAETVDLPGWTGRAPDWRPRPPPAEPALPTRLAPSRPEGAALGTVPPAASPRAMRAGRQARMRRGQALHALLQHLPDLPEADRAEAARRYLARPGLGLDPEAAAATLAEVTAVLDDPALAALFGPGSRAEVPLTGVVGGQVVGGLVDRLVVLPDRVLVADYKTNRAPPRDADSVPLLYLRQMAAYRAVLLAAFPGRAVECLLVWTVGARVMPLSPERLDSHAPGPPNGRAD